MYIYLQYVHIWEYIISYLSLAIDGEDKMESTGLYIKNASGATCLISPNITVYGSL